MSKGPGRRHGHRERLVAGTALCAVVIGTAVEARGQAPGFTLDFEGPSAAAGVPPVPARAGFKCRISAATAGPGVPEVSGASAWTFGVEALGDCAITFATAIGSVSAPIEQGGMRSGGFELTELTVGPGNEGAVSAVVLGEDNATVLPPESRHHLLGIEVEGAVPVSGGCVPCTLRYRSGLTRSDGTPVGLEVTAGGSVTVPSTVDAGLEICNATCFADEQIPDWSLWQVGAILAGAARRDGELIEICSASGGYGGPSDSLLLLGRDVAGDFTVEAEVVSVEGEAGVEARAFSGTGADPRAAAIRITARQVSMPGGQDEAEVVTAFRALSGADFHPPSPAVRMPLPVRLGVRQEGGVLTTYASSGTDRTDLLTVPVAGTGLEGSFHRVGLAHGSDPADLNPVPGAAPRPGGVFFRDALFLRPPDPELPLLSADVRGFQGVPGRSTTIILGGLGLSSIQEVTVAGLPAEIIEVRGNEMEILVPPTMHPTRGDIVAHTAAGDVVLPNAFFSYGEQFIRCDCNGDGTLDISDAVASLGRMFLGDAPCRCGESQDCNDDDETDISDPIFLLSFLFLGLGTPPPPYPEPGADAVAGLCFPDLPSVNGLSTGVLRAGDSITITGTGFSPVPEENVVLAGDAVLKVIEASPTSLTAVAEAIVSGGEVPVFVMTDVYPANQDCGPRGCNNDLRIGAMGRSSGPGVVLVPPLEPEFQVLGTSRNEEGVMVLELDPAFFDPTRPLTVIASLISAVVPDASPGARVTRFEHSFTRGAETTFEEALGELAVRLQKELSGGGPMPEVIVLAEPEIASIVIQPQNPAVGGPDVPCVFTALYWQWLEQYSGRCGPNRIRPITFGANTERNFAWCRFQELVATCKGLPRFEWFIPLENVLSPSGSLTNLPHPDFLSPKQKSILYSSEAYCHVRQFGLWNRCVLEDLIRNGVANVTSVPDFPPTASIVKTEWRTDDPGAPADDRLGPGVDPSKFYSYVYTGDGRRWYLTALHHITQDLPTWFWYDIYVPRATAAQSTSSDSFPLHAGTGGCGGTNLDAPPPIASSTWKSYFLCTNVLPQQPYVSSGFAGVGPDFTKPNPAGNSAWCGNFEFSTECPDVIDGGGGQDTCVRCHARAKAPTTKPLVLDYLYSLAHPIAAPDPCPTPVDPGPTPVKFSTHVAPFFAANCACHTGGAISGGLQLSPSVAYGNLVNKPSTQSSLVRVKPGMPEMSYLMHKLKNTHLGPPANGSGVCMPYNSCSSLSASTLTMLEKWILDGANP